MSETRTITKQEADGTLAQITYLHSHAKGATIPKLASSLGISEADATAVVKRLGDKVKQHKGEDGVRYLVPNID